MPAAPPLARGSTPAGRSVRARRRRLPRSRGGSTPSEGQHDDGGDGSPARAGIGPMSSMSRGHASTAPPLARGSTLCAPPPGRAGGGSPARAGIDPQLALPLTVEKRLPRSRGDRPKSRARTTLRTWAPPLARGSTRCPLLRRVRRRGSPARAGIDPARRRARDPPHGLPRSRGDRPVRAQLRVQLLEAPPLARGIDPGRCAFLRPDSRLPRSRGDRPSATSGGSQWL